MLSDDKWVLLRDEKPRSGIHVLATVRTRDSLNCPYDGIDFVRYDNQVMIVVRVLVRDIHGRVVREYYVDDDYDELLNNSEVIAWMPLPTAYRGE